MGEFLAQIPRERGKGGGKGKGKKEGSTSIPVGSKLAEAWSQPGARRKWQKEASIPEDVFRDYLQQCRNRSEEPTTRGVLRLATVLADAQRNQGRKERGGVVESLEELMDQQKTFGTIYADPPWAYTNQGTRARTDRHYPTLSVAELVALPVQEVARANSHLHLWTTNSFLPDALAVLEAWGFVYKSVFVWCKPHYGIGNYWRVAHEFLLLGVRGRCPFRDKGQRSWQEFPRTKHSKKPEEVRQLIGKVSPGPYLELFGRKAVQGWTVVGNEVDT